MRSPAPTTLLRPSASAGCAAVLLLACLAGCSAQMTRSGDGIIEPGPLRIDPPELTVNLSADRPAYLFLFSLRSALYGDVTAQAEWSLTNLDIGQISSGRLTVPEGLKRGGQGLVIATFRGTTATAPLRVKLHERAFVDPSAGPAPEGEFAGTTAAGVAPALVYPLDGVLLPRNLPEINLQWRGEIEHRLYRLTLDGPVYARDFYAGAARCQSGRWCQFTLGGALWRQVVEGAAGTPLSLSVTGTTGRGGRAATSQAITLELSPDDVRGGLYYFSTSQWGILRLPFGGSQALPFLIGDRTTKAGSCIGCHTTPPDGKRVAALFGGGDGFGGIVDGTDPSIFLRRPQPIEDGRAGFSAQRTGQVWNFATYHPTAEQLITTWAGVMELRDGRTGAWLRTVPRELLGGEATMPEWSPDGRSVVFVRIPRGFGKLGKDLAPARDFGELTAGDWITHRAGDLAVLPVVGGEFGPAWTLLAASELGDFHFYPSISPDSRWIVFNSARYGECGTDTGDQQGVQIGPDKCTSYDQRNARLRLIALRPGAAPIELARATIGRDLTASWPRFAPFQQRGGDLVFITFSNKADYGFVLVQPPERDKRRPQLWMAALDLQRAHRGEDASYAPFWLPFQDPSERNHQAFWTHQVLCRKREECGRGFECLNAACVPRIE